LPLDDHRVPLEEGVPFEVIEPFDDSHRGGSGVTRA
jgi:hypothetical protein